LKISLPFAVRKVAFKTIMIVIVIARKLAVSYIVIAFKGAMKRVSGSKFAAK
jgi:hypothetical protein